MIDATNKLIILDRRMEPLADLENAYDIVEDERINTISHISFALPYNDFKNQYCTAFNYIRNPGGELYRIMFNSKTINEEGDWEYRGEHVFATLIDKTIQRPIVMDGAGAGGTTSAVIRQILEMQEVRNWVLGECDFNFNFEYGWLGESLLSAILDVPHHFIAPFQWTFDTSRHPFVLNLKRLNPDKDPDLYIEQGKNRISATRRVDQTSVVTRLFPYGYGEYPNRLTIESVNNGVDYVQSPPEIFSLYPNAIEATFVDRRFHNPQSLLEVARAILYEAQTPFEEYEVELSELDGDPFSTPFVGGLADIVDFKKTFIVGIKWKHKEIPECTLTLANRTRDIANEVLRLRNRVRIESTYAQGVTQFWQAHDKGNATPQRSFWLPLFIPSSMRIVNFITVDVDVQPFALEVENRRTEQPSIGTTGLMTLTEAQRLTGWMTTRSADNPWTTGLLAPVNIFNSNNPWLTGGLSARDAGNPFTTGMMTNTQLNTGSHTVGLTWTALQFNAGSLGTFSAGTLPSASLAAGSFPSLSGGSNPSLSGGSWPTLQGGEHTHSWSLSGVGSHSHSGPSHVHNVSLTASSAGLVSGATGSAGEGNTSTEIIGTIGGTTAGSSATPSLSGGSWPTLSGGNQPSLSGGALPSLTWNAGALPSLQNRVLPSIAQFPNAALTNNNHNHLITNHNHIQGAHTHNLGNHRHLMTNHRHYMTDHLHFMPHTHLLEPGIQTVGNPTSFTLRINGQDRETVEGRRLTMQIQKWMGGTGGGINTNFMHRIEVIPNVPAYVSITLIVQGFLMAEREMVI